MAKKASDAIVSQTGNHFYGAGGLVAIAAFFGNYVNFTGRSTRREYWWWTLWQFLLGAIYWGIIIGSVGLTSLKKDPTSLIMSMLGFLLVALLFALAILLPSLALGIRRFRDAGVHWGVYVALQVATVAAVFLLHDQSTIQSILTMAISLVSLVIAILPTKNPPVDETDSWAEA